MELEEQIEQAVRKHREVELSITPKVHMIEDHVLHQYRQFPDDIALLLEDFVE